MVRLFSVVACITIMGLLASAQVLKAQSEPTEPQKVRPQETASKPDSMPPTQPSGSISASRCSTKVSSSVAQPTPGQPANMPFTYTPLSVDCKFQLFLRQTYSPYTFASAAFEATWAQMWAQWPQYGGGMQGWGKRLGATLADTESRRFIQNFMLATVFHQDPRYFPSGKKRLIARAWYATTRVAVTKRDDGQNVFNSSELLGALSASSLQNAYYPEHYRTFNGTMNRFLGTLSSDATSELLREFAPDLKRVFHRHAPRKIQELERKVPLPPGDGP